jgi:hypothetical protein
MVAALCLAVASLKVQTMAPFLLLFLRRSDRRTWIFLVLIVAGLLLAAGNPLELPASLRSMLQANAEARQPGKPNDVSTQNFISHTMIGFDHAFLRLGVSNPAVVGALNYLCIAALGLWLAYLALARPDLPRGALCALVSLYSMLFLYHRLYDLVILVLPLVYCAGRFRVSSGPARWCYGWTLLAIVLVLNAPYGEFLRLQHSPAAHPVLKALVLPSVTYLILSALAALAGAVFLESQRKPATQAQAPLLAKPSPSAALVG